MIHVILKLRSLRNTHGQDLIEYALMAGFVAVAAGRGYAGRCVQHQHDLLAGRFGDGDRVHPGQLKALNPCQ